MEQTFLSYALTDARFALASGAAIARTFLLPVVALTVGLLLIGTGAAGIMSVMIALLMVGMVEWAALIVRMARRIALGEWDASAMADLDVVPMTRALIRAFF